MANTSTTELDLLKSLTTSGGATDSLNIVGNLTTTPSGTQTVAGTVAVSNFPGTQPISAASLPLPTNAAQETSGNLATINTSNINIQEFNNLMLLELRAIRMALVALVCEGGRNTPADFDPSVNDFNTPGNMN